MLVRIAALVAVDAPPVSYMLNIGAAGDIGIDAEKMRGVFAAIAPIVGTARIASATGKIVRATGLAMDMAELEEETASPSRHGSTAGSCHERAANTTCADGVRPSGALDQPEARRDRSRLTDRGRGGREPGPRGRQCRAALDRQGVRRLADGARPGCRRLLARPGRVGALLRRDRRPLRAQAAARHRDGRDGARGLPGGVGAVDRGPVRRAGARRARGRHGLPDHARADHRALVRARPHEGDRAVGGDRRCDQRARAALLGDPARPLLVGLGLPAHAAARGRSRSSWRSGSCRPT